MNYVLAAGSYAISMGILYLAGEKKHGASSWAACSLCLLTGVLYAACLIHLSLPNGLEGTL